MKTFNVPITYRSPLITALKNRRREEDKMKRDFMPAFLEQRSLHIYLARHFGFCYGVENAIEISFRTIDDNPGKRIFLLSEMIHNPLVNADLGSRGVRFIQDTYGNQLIPFEDLLPGDIVINPAFGATLEIRPRRLRRDRHPNRKIQHDLSIRRKGMEQERPDGEKRIYRHSPRQARTRRDKGHFFPRSSRFADASRPQHAGSP